MRNLLLILILLQLPAYAINICGKATYKKTLSISEIQGVKPRKFWKLLIYPLIDENLSITGIKFLIKINAD